MDKLTVGIVGVSGYGGGELARLLLQHPHVELSYVTSGTYAGQPLSAALPGTTGRTHLVCEKFDPAVASEKCDFLFLAGENGLAMKIAPLLLEAGKKVVDLSADFRLKRPGDLQRVVQGGTHRAAVVRGGSLRPAGTVSQCHQNGPACRQSWLLPDFSDPSPGAHSGRSSISAASS